MNGGVRSGTGGLSDIAGDKTVSAVSGERPFVERHDGEINLNEVR